jgi:DNA-binding PucR family transcriptional regulator
VADRLAPLRELRPSQGARLSQTLASWLRNWGARHSVSAELGIHPQTVSYRLTQLRELYGAALDDPKARFELALALRADAPGGNAIGGQTNPVE